MTLRSSERCMTDEWEEFIVEAQKQWEEVQLRTLENIQESLGDDKQDNNDDDTLLWEGDLMLKTLPEVWTLAGDLEEPQITLKAEMEGGCP